MIDKSLIWGALPWEADGGAVVAYYLYRMLNYLNPEHEFFGIPKVSPALSGEALPFMQFKTFEYNRGLARANKHLFKQIPEFMYKNHIPLLTMWHIPWEFFPMVNVVKKVGGKTLIHQTVHWKTDLLFKSKVLGNVDAWVAPTRWAEEQLRLVGRIKRKKIKYLPHAVNVEKFYPHDTAYRKSLNLKPNQKVILVVGRCSLAKGLHQVIPVMRNIIRDYDAVFIIKAGVFPQIDKSEEIAYVLRMMSENNPNIIWIPDWTPPEVMEELMASCDILLQPSGHEGFDVPLIEAMACKKAIAVTTIPNHYEIMGSRNRYCGLFMEPSVVAEVLNDGKQEVKVPSTDMIDGSLRFLLENPEECKAYGDNGYSRVRRNYNLAKVGSDWLDYIDELFPEDFEMKMKIED